MQPAHQSRLDGPKAMIRGRFPRRGDVALRWPGLGRRPGEGPWSLRGRRSEAEGHADQRPEDVEVVVEDRLVHVEGPVAKAGHDAHVVPPLVIVRAQDLPDGG